ncbi:MAG: hypothetical protein ACRCUY_05685 [Thermoguttaceae bacterium]
MTHFSGGNVYFDILCFELIHGNFQRRLRVVFDHDGIELYSHLAIHLSPIASHISPFTSRHQSTNKFSFAKTVR